MPSRKAASHLPLTLTGTVYDRDEIEARHPKGEVILVEPKGDEPEEALATVGKATLAIAYREYTPLLAGDVAIYPRMDMYGRHAARGKHTNYGYSGYFRASVYDGSQWRAFSIWHFVPEVDRHYETMGDRNAVRQRLVEHVKARSGQQLAWGNRAYELADKPVMAAEEQPPHESESGSA